MTLAVNDTESLVSIARTDLERDRSRATEFGGSWLRWGCGCEQMWEYTMPGLYLCAYHEKMERDVRGW